MLRREVGAVLQRLLWKLGLVLTIVASVSFARGRTRKPSQSPLQKALELHFPQVPNEILKNSQRSTTTFPVQWAQHDWALGNIGLVEAVQGKEPLHKLGNCKNTIVVAVIDTGIDYTHPELRQSVWVNKGESGPWEPQPGEKTTCHDKSCNGIDDDGNGYVDDFIGWDFVNDVALPYDTHGHGTHISGIISNSPKNEQGVLGVCPEVTIMPLKYYDSAGLGYNNLQNTVKAIRYAVRMGAHIINYSGGGAEPAASEKEAIEEAQRKGILFVAAAGNDGHNNDHQKYYPASYPLSNIISVASLDSANRLLPSSNYGIGFVQLAAPGLGILSTLPGGGYGTMSGTSQATAYVTGAAALLASNSNQAFHYNPIKLLLLSGAKPLKSQMKNISNGVLWIARSLELQKNEKAFKKPVPAEVALTR